MQILIVMCDSVDDFSLGDSLREISGSLNAVADAELVIALDFSDRGVVLKDREGAAPYPVTVLEAK